MVYSALDNDYRSSLAQLSPSTITNGVLFVALKAYYDGSVADGLSMALAGVAADESVWSSLEPEWQEILTFHGAPYMHMNEAIPRIGVFEGWSEDDRDELIWDLIEVLHCYRDGPLIRRFSCSVDLEVYRRAKVLRPHIPKPERICARIVVPNIGDWYGERPEDFGFKMDMYFDRGEPYMRHIYKDWQDKKYRQKHPVWRLVRTIAPVEMATTIPIQIADMMAWSINRIKTSDINNLGPYEHFAYSIANTTILALHAHAGEAFLMNDPLLPEGA